MSNNHDSNKLFYAIMVLVIAAFGGWIFLMIKLMKQVNLN